MILIPAGGRPEAGRPEFQDKPGLLHGDCYTLFSKKQTKKLTFVSILGKGNSS